MKAPKPELRPEAQQRRCGHLEVGTSTAQPRQSQAVVKKTLSTQNCKFLDEFFLENQLIGLFRLELFKALHQQQCKNSSPRTEATKDQGEAHSEFAFNWLGPASNKPLHEVGFNLLRHHAPSIPLGVLAASTCPPGHLHVLAAPDGPLFTSIELLELAAPGPIEDHSSARHVHPHSEGLGRAKDSDKAFLANDAK